MNKRVRSIFDRLDDELDMIVISNYTDPFIDDTFFYVTGFETGLFEGCVAFLYPDGDCEVLVSRLEETSARKGSVDVTVFSTRDEFESMVSERLKNASKVGINAKALVQEQYRRLERTIPDATFVDCSEAILAARAIKDKDEIDRIRHACSIASDVARSIPSFLHKGVREYEVAAEIEYSMKKAGADGPSFATISSFGKNAAEPHYTAGGDMLAPDMFALFDFGTRYKRYVSDITRTFFFGRPSEEDKELYETVREAQQIGFDAIEVGRPLSVPHKEVDAFFDTTPFKGRFIHGLGHGIGLSVHEPLRVAPLEKRVMEPGMVITIEPGLYFPGKGGVRIEDDVLIKKDGIEVLTSAPRDFIEL